MERLDIYIILALTSAMIVFMIILLYAFMKLRHSKYDEEKKRIEL